MLSIDPNGSENIPTYLKTTITHRIKNRSSNPHSIHSRAIILEENIKIEKRKLKKKSKNIFRNAGQSLSHKKPLHSHSRPLKTKLAPIKLSQNPKSSTQQSIRSKEPSSPKQGLLHPKESPRQTQAIHSSKRHNRPVSKEPTGFMPASKNMTAPFSPQISNNSLLLRRSRSDNSQNINLLEVQSRSRHLPSSQGRRNHTQTIKIQPHQQQYLSAQNDSSTEKMQIISNYKDLYQFKTTNKSQSRRSMARGQKYHNPYIVRKVTNIQRPRFHANRHSFTDIVKKSKYLVLIDVGLRGLPAQVDHRVVKKVAEENTTLKKQAQRNKILIDFLTSKIFSIKLIHSLFKKGKCEITNNDRLASWAGERTTRSRLLEPPASLETVPGGSQSWSGLAPPKLEILFASSCQGS